MILNFLLESVFTYIY